MATVIIDNDPCGTKIVGTKDPIVLRLIGDSAIITPASPEKRLVTFISNPGVGDSMSYSVNGITGTINFVSSVSTPGQECAVIGGSQTLTQWITDNLIPVLLMQPAFDGFEFSVGGPSSTLTIYSLEDADYDITITHTGYTATTTTEEGTPIELSPDYYLKVQVQMTSDQSNTVFPIRSPWLYFKPQIVNGEAVVEQDLKEIADSLFQEIDIPDEAGQSNAACFYSVRKMRIACVEYYADSEDTNYITYTATCRVVKGGRKFGDGDITIEEEYDGKFLTLRKDVYTDKRMYDWLYFQQPLLSVGTKLWVRTSTLYDDGNWVDRDTQQITSTSENRITRIPCGFDQLQLNLFTGTPVAYKVSIIRTTSSNIYIEDVIEPIQFTLLDESDYVAGIHYQNCFGFIEAIVLNGSAQFMAKHSRDLENTMLPFESTRDVHRQIAFNVVNQFEIDTTTGPLSKRGWLAAMDIHLSKRIWFVWVQGKNFRHPVQLVPGDAAIPVFNPDGGGTAQLPLKLRFTPERTNSIRYQIIDQ